MATATSTETIATTTTLKTSRPNLFLRLLRRPDGIVGALIVLGLVIVALFAQQIAPYPIDHADLMAAKQPPMWQEGGSSAHILGTDKAGQDILSRIIFGTRISLTVGLFGVTLALLIGVTLGLIAGYFGGWLDTIITGFTNLILSIPYLVLVIVIATVLGRSLVNVILIFGVTNAPIFIRFTRGEVMRVKKLEYIDAAHALGTQTWRIIPKYVLPNLAGSLITLATFEMSAMIFYESGLSFLGLSVPPSVPSWGNMLALGRASLRTYPWMAVYPGLAIAITSLGMNLLGDWLRDALDPRSS